MTLITDTFVLPLTDNKGNFSDADILWKNASNKLFIKIKNNVDLGPITVYKSQHGLTEMHYENIRK